MKKEEVIKRINPKFLEGVAHRGLHNEEFTENGLKAFENAIKNNVAFEFDIHLSKDNKLIVCHDENLKRTTGKEGIIADLTSEEIRTNYRLLDGGVVPTLDELLELNNEQVPMVIELKAYNKNHKKLAEVTKEYLKKIKDKRNVLIISFDVRCLWHLKKEGFIRQLLVWKGDKYMFMFRNTVESVDLDKLLFEDRRVRNYSKKHFVNVWTIENEEDLNKVLPYADTITFQHIDKDLIKNSLKK